MPKFKIINILLITIIILILDKLYLLPIYVPLDTKPDSKRLATYLAKNIGKKSKCDIQSPFLVNFNTTEKDKIFEFSCILQSDAIFSIYIFLDTKSKNEMLKNRNNNIHMGHHKQCFKKGAAYMICEPYSINYNNKKYYKQFSGEDIEYMDN